MKKKLKLIKLWIVRHSEKSECLFWLKTKNIINPDDESTVKKQIEEYENM